MPASINPFCPPPIRSLQQCTWCYIKPTKWDGIKLVSLLYLLGGPNRIGLALFNWNICHIRGKYLNIDCMWYNFSINIDRWIIIKSNDAHSFYYSHNFYALTTSSTNNDLISLILLFNNLGSALSCNQFACDLIFPNLMYYPNLAYFSSLLSYLDHQHLSSTTNGT